MPMRLFLTETLLFSYLIFIYMVMQSPTTGASLPGLSLTGPLSAAVNILFFSCAASAGMFVFAFLGRTPFASGRRATGIFFVLGAVGRLVMEAVPGLPGLYTVALFFTMTSWGYLVGLVSCRVATEVAPSYFGRFIGGAHGLAAMLHFILSTLDAGNAALPSVRAASFLTLCALARLLFVGDPFAPKTEARLPASPIWRRVFPQGLPLILAGLAFVSLLQGFGDVLAVLHQDEYEPVFGLTRFFYAGGLFFFGWLADVHFFSLPVAMIFAKSYFFWYQLFGDKRGIFPLFSCLDELLQASFVVLLSVAFLHIAARSDRPERWAATGRMVELPLMGVGLCAGLVMQDRASLSLMLAVYMTLLLFAIYTAYRFGLLYIRALRAEPRNDGTTEAGAAFRVAVAMGGASLATAGVPGTVPPMTMSPGATAVEAEPDAAVRTGPDLCADEDMTADGHETLPAEAPDDTDADESIGNVSAAAAGETIANESTQNDSAEAEDDAEPGESTEDASAETEDDTAAEAEDVPAETQLSSEFLDSLRTGNAAFASYCARYLLTEREADVLIELLRGRKAADIAGTLFITERTARYHINNLLKKTENHSQLSLVSSLVHEITQKTRGGENGAT